MKKRLPFILGTVAGFAWRALSSNPNAVVFVVGLGVLCASVPRWSGPLAGAIAGLSMMAVAVWPFVTVRRSAG